MKHVHLFEGFVNQELNEKIILQGFGGGISKELKSLPVIDFSKLPQRGRGDSSSFKDSLHAAGFPIEIQDPTREDLNFPRYYTVTYEPGSGYADFVKKEKAPIPNYLLSLEVDKAFDKYPCIKTAYERGEITGIPSADGVIRKFSTRGLQSKYYTSDGKVTFPSGSNTPGKPNTVTGTYSCKNGKLIDSFIKNPRGQVYSNNNPWVMSDRSDKPNSDSNYIPWYTKDPVGSNWVANIQQKLIDLGYLRIAKPTGYMGNMTKSAIMTAADYYASADQVNQTNGIKRKFYNHLMNLKKGQ